MNKEQWISVEFPQPTAVYGIIMQGSPLYKEHVVTYNVFYSPDNENNFKPVTVPGTKVPALFRGSKNATGAQKVIFGEPIVAKIVKIQPQSWDGAISIRFELLGCKNIIEFT